MSLAGEQTLLRFYLQSADRAPHTPTHERIISAARRKGLAGATALRGIMGLGSRGMLKPGAWSLAEHVPVIVEIVDSAERISDFLANDAGEHWVEGMATLERAGVMLYRHRAQEEGNRLGLAAAVQPLSTVPRIEPRRGMTIKENGVLLRVFIGESDRAGHQPLHEAIVGKARELGLAGATVLRGSEGFGANSVVHKSGLLAMSTDLPIVIEIVDAEEKIGLLLPHLETMVQEGMITMEHVMIVMYRTGKNKSKTE